MSDLTAEEKALLGLDPDTKLVHVETIDAPSFYGTRNALAAISCVAYLAMAHEALASGDVPMSDDCTVRGVTCLGWHREEGDASPLLSTLQAQVAKS